MGNRTITEPRVAQSADQELTDRFEQFYRNYYREEIGELAQRYPNEQRSLYVDWNDLYRFDPDLADDYLAQPDQIHDYAREALRLYDLPVDVSLGQAHVRVSSLPEVTEIRGIRAHDVNTFVSVQGIVRKATDVRPKIEEAAFECQRCGTLTYIPQSGGSFQEPHECQGCERQGPFTINYDQSTFIDAQKLRVQESPEGLRGGETPQSIDVTIEDDITGRATPGDHVTVTGVLRIEQQESGGQKSRLFDVHMDGHALKVEDEEFEEMDIDDEDVQEILELAKSDDIYQLMVDSIAPTIYGFDTTKLAITLQLFSGVTKHLPDESRIRGDMHILLIGDPGTGKCVSGDTNVTLADGSEIEIRDLVESHLTDPTPIDDGVYQAVDIPVPSLDVDGSISHKRATKVWKREAPETMYRIRTASGHEVEVTPSHPLFLAEDGRVQARKAENLTRGEFIARPKCIPTEPDDTLDIGYRPSQANNAIRLDLPDRWTPSLARLIGYIIAEGLALLRDDNTADLRITNNDREVIADVVAELESLGLNYTIAPPRSGKSTREIRCGSSEFVSFLEHLEPAILERSACQRVPADLFTTSSEIKAAFLKAYIEAEGTVSSKEREITVGSMSEELLEGVRSVLVSLGIHSQLAPRAGGSYRLRISGDDFVEYVSRIGFVSERKRASAGAFEGTGQNTNKDVLPNVGDQLREIRESLRLAQSECGLPRPTYQHYERGDRNPSRESLQAILGAFKARLASLRETKTRIQNGDWGDIEAVRHGLNISQQYLADRMSVTQTAISYYERNQVVPDGGHTVDAKQAVLDRIDDALAVSSDVEQLETFYRNEIVWDKITRIEEFEPKDDWVYDLEVADTHNYLSNNIISHNSQILQYIRHISPRSVYTSGKGSSSAGITAAAVRDDFGDGQQWSLEAGALVLADKGVAAVDELDKMRCVTGDSLVQMADGEVVPIRELARRSAKTGEIEQLENGRTIRGIQETVKTMTDDGRIVSRPVTAIHEYRAPQELVEVTLQSGETLTTTQDHPFFVYENGERKQRPADQLREGEWTVVPRSIPCTTTDGGFVESISGDATLPNDLSPAMGGILGYLAGDGNIVYDRPEGIYGIRLTNKEEELLSHFEELCQDTFGRPGVRYPSDQRDNGIGTIQLRGKDHVDDVLDAGANLEIYDGKILPRGVTTACREAKAAFIRALADSEGSVDDRMVNIASSSYRLLLGVKKLLLEFGITSQIQTREREEKRDLHYLVITAKSSLDAFRSQIGFTLTRKQRALKEACNRVSGDRTIIDVIPNCGCLLREARSGLRLYQSECGIGDATYCNFENGDANISFSRARTILRRFENRLEQIHEDRRRLENPCSWEQLDELVERYHVSQRELASGLDIAQQTVSERWGEDRIREDVRNRLHEILEDAGQTDLTNLEDLVHGDVAWRRVADIRRVAPDTVDDDRIPILRHRLAEILVRNDPDGVVEDARELLDQPLEAGDWQELRSLLEQHAISFQEIASKMDVAGSTVSRWFTETVQTGNFEKVRSVGFELIREKQRSIRSLLDEIDARSQHPRVYDLTVEGTHNFVANGMVVHNSEDRSAMHQALEQQEISISKAGINATLKSRCALLGAANPKYGRFDQYEPIGEQIDLEPALVSRFDLIFTVTDQPDEEKDAALADHILQTNYAGELGARHKQLASPNVTAEEVAESATDVDPAIDPDLFRKYIAYAKRNVFPSMTDEARSMIKDFYVDLRARGTDEDAPVPITARKLEALVRLAEASARVRLSDTVEPADAERVIDIVRTCLKDIGVDPETGQFDADVIETGTSKSQRDRIKTLRGLIEELEGEYDRGAPVEEVLSRAEDIGMSESQVEHEIEKLRQRGEIYEPAQNHLRTT